MPIAIRRDHVVGKHADDILVTQVASAEVVIAQLLFDDLYDVVEAVISKDLDSASDRSITSKFGLQHFKED